MIDLSNKAITRNNSSKTTIIKLNKSNRSNKGSNGIANFMGTRRFIICLISFICFLPFFGSLIYLLISGSSTTQEKLLIFIGISLVTLFINLIVFAIDLFSFIPKSDLTVEDAESRVNFSYIRIFSVIKFVGIFFSFAILIGFLISILLFDLNSNYLSDITLFNIAIWSSLLLGIISFVTNILSFFETKFNRGIMNEQ